jgi:plastocyanin
MTDSFLPSGSRFRRVTWVGSALVLILSAWTLACSDATPVTTTPAQVLTSVKITTSNNLDSFPVGFPIGVHYAGLDQHGREMSLDSADKRLSDTTIASFVWLPGNAATDYEPYSALLGSTPGNVELTVTASAGGVSAVGTQLISILPSDSGVVSAEQSGDSWLFGPTPVTVTRLAGAAAVTWVVETGSHSVYWDSQPSGAAVAGIDSFHLGFSEYDPVTRHFTVAGRYEYHCLVHPEMTGTIVVQ